MTDQSVSEGKRNTILDAARGVFSRQGYSASAMDDVAEEAGIAKGTLYLYFKSKEDLYLAALVRDMRDLSQKAMAEMARGRTFRKKIEAFLRVRLEYSKAQEDFLRIYLAEYGSMFIKTPVRKELCHLARENMQHVAGMVEDAMKNKEIRTLPAGPVAAAIFDVARGLMERRLLGWKEFKTRDEIAFATDLLWRGIGREA
jgi:AcrR family transcriptional regulator